MVDEKVTLNDSKKVVYIGSEIPIDETTFKQEIAQGKSQKNRLTKA